VLVLYAYYKRTLLSLILYINLTNLPIEYQEGLQSLYVASARERVEKKWKLWNLVFGNVLVCYKQRDTQAAQADKDSWNQSSRFFTGNGTK
jgi:hypothetical protein